MINWGHVLYSKYVPWLFLLALLGSLALFARSMLQLQLSLPGGSLVKDVFESYILPYENVASVEAHMWSIYYALGWKWTLLCGLATAYMWQLKSPVYLLDHATFQPPKDWQVNHKDILKILKNIGPNFTDVRDDSPREPRVSPLALSTHCGWPFDSPSLLSLLTDRNLSTSPNAS